MTAEQRQMSRRGRRQDDSLPPSRARDVQRAFRARKAEQLVELTQRVRELEDENDVLRARLGDPPVERHRPEATSTSTSTSSDTPSRTRVRRGTTESVSRSDSHGSSRASRSPATSSEGRASENVGGDSGSFTSFDTGDWSSPYGLASFLPVGNYMNQSMNTQAFPQAHHQSQIIPQPIPPFALPPPFQQAQFDLQAASSPAIGTAIHSPVPQQGLPNNALYRPPFMSYDGSLSPQLWSPSPMYPPPNEHPSYPRPEP